MMMIPVMWSNMLCVVNKSTIAIILLSFLVLMKTSYMYSDTSKMHDLVVKFQIFFPGGRSPRTPPFGFFGLALGHSPPTIMILPATPFLIERAHLSEGQVSGSVHQQNYLPRKYGKEYFSPALEAVEKAFIMEEFNTFFC